MPSISAFVIIFFAMSTFVLIDAQVWSTATLSEARGYLAVTSVGDLALFGGGSNSTSFSARVDIYNSTSGTWSTATLSEARNYLAATTVGDLALFGGGWFSS